MYSLGLYADVLGASGASLLFLFFSSLFFFLVGVGGKIFNKINLIKNKVFFFFFCFVFVFRDRVSLYSPGCPGLIL